MLQLEPGRSASTWCVGGGSRLQHNPFRAAHLRSNELRLNLFNTVNNALRRYSNDAIAPFCNADGRERGVSLLQRRADEQLIAMGNEVKCNELHGGALTFVQGGFCATQP